MAHVNKSKLSLRVSSKSLQPDQISTLLKVVGIFMEAFNEGFSISPEVMKMIADRQLQIGFDIYGPDAIATE